MTDKIICKYLFQEKEKFDGKPYCTCFTELCEDLPICDDNCQIFEDYKRLKRKEEIINELEKIAEKYQTDIERDALSLPAAIKSIIQRKEQEYYNLKFQLQIEQFRKEEEKGTRLQLEQKVKKLEEKLNEY